MNSGVRVMRSTCAAFLLALWPAAAWSTGNPVVQSIGQLSGDVAKAVSAEVTVVPFSPANDARSTPIILAPGKAFVSQDRSDKTTPRILGLAPAERNAIRQAYQAGQTIMVLDASAHDVEALHVLLRDGVIHEAVSDPISLAYALRRENNIPTATTVAPVLSTSPENNLSESEEQSLERAIDAVVAELLYQPVVSEVLSLPIVGDDDVMWSDFPAQRLTFKSTSKGIWNTPVQVYALHACEPDIVNNKFYDYFLINVEGDWTPTEAKYQGASEKAGELYLDDQNELVVNWQDRASDDRDPSRCDGGIAICRNFPCFNPDNRICRYVDYPLNYEIVSQPPSGPTVAQVDAAPEGDQGQSTTYSSGFRWTLGLSANVSGGGGIQANVSWDNTTQASVPALTILAGDTPQQEGAFTTYKYCTAGTTAECTSSIQMVSAGGACQRGNVGTPQGGQTPVGKFDPSAATHTALWQVDPDTYGDTFDLNVTWKVDLGTSTSRLWSGYFNPQVSGGPPPSGPQGYCNPYGCSCSIQTTTASVVKEYTFKIPRPSQTCAR